MSFVVFKKKDKNFLYVFTNPPTFLIRKVGKRISRRLRHFILAKFLRFQGTFYKKSLGRGLGLTAPTDNAHKKHGGAVLLYCRNMLELAFQTSFSYFSYKKSKQKNFTSITPFYFGKAFEAPRNFSRKVFCVRVWGGQPQLIMLTKKHGIAVFF